MTAIKGLVFVLLIVSALLINGCCSYRNYLQDYMDYKDENMTTTVNTEYQCKNATCHRRLNHLGVRETSGCPDGCLCVIRAPNHVDNANGTCYELMPTTTTKTATTSGTSSLEDQE
ncbi:complement inhibitor RaCI6-like [Dermacentor variabilis]|uniref:complement inhibitor RaCI6-like n=1 Tax=Dermacentor variabilis TaxID=34621 RepID=UPI003F5B43E0